MTTVVMISATLALLAASLSAFLGALYEFLAHERIVTKAHSNWAEWALLIVSLWCAYLVVYHSDLRWRGLFLLFVTWSLIMLTRYDKNRSKVSTKSQISLFWQLAHTTAWLLLMVAIL